MRGPGYPIRIRLPLQNKPTAQQSVHFWPGNLVFSKSASPYNRICVHIHTFMANSSSLVVPFSTPSFHDRQITRIQSSPQSQYISIISCSLKPPSAAVPMDVGTTKVEVVPAVIVGGGRVGRMLQDLGHGQDLLIKRGESVPLDFDGPILVCTRNDDLDHVLQATPQSRWRDLVFFQNGMLEPWFESKGLGNPDQVLAYFAVSKLGEPPVDGKTDTNPEGLTAAYGKWASVVADRLLSGGLSCKELDKEAFQKQMLEKLIWISAFMLVGARHPGATVGIVVNQYRPEVSSLIAELAAAAASEKGIVFEEGMEQRLCAYSRAVAHFPTAVKEFKWRNGWFYSITEKALAEGKRDPCPLHTAWLKEVNVI